MVDYEGLGGTETAGQKRRVPGRLSACLKLIKYINLLVTLIMLILALVMIVVGAWAIFNKSTLASVIYIHLPIGLLLMGVFVLGLTVLGCLGTWKENVFHLKIYLGLMFLLVVCELIIGGKTLSLKSDVLNINSEIAARENVLSQHWSAADNDAWVAVQKFEFPGTPKIGSISRRVAPDANGFRCCGFYDPIPWNYDQTCVKITPVSLIEEGERMRDLKYISNERGARRAETTPSTSSNTTSLTPAPTPSPSVAPTPSPVPKKPVPAPTPAEVLSKHACCKETQKWGPLNSTLTSITSTLTTTKSLSITSSTSAPATDTERCPASQTREECCGFEWNYDRVGVPAKGKEAATIASCKESKLMGCYRPLANYVSSRLKTAGRASVIIGIFQLIGLLFTIIMILYIPSKDDPDAENFNRFHKS